MIVHFDRTTGYHMIACLRRTRLNSSVALLSAVWAFIPLTAVAGERHSHDSSLFSLDQYREHITYLASDELEGRGTGQEGIDRAAEYIAAEFERLGVEPAGDDDTYFQNFKLTLQRRIGDATRLAVGTDGRRMRKPLTVDEDFRPFPFSSSGAFKGDVVFVGYGIVDDDMDYNDYEGLDVTDKVVLMIRRAPEFDDFDANAHQSFRAKASRANARGAAAVLIVNKNGDADSGLYPFGQFSGGFGAPSYGVPMMHITESAADDMLKAGGLDSLRKMQEKIERTKKPASAVLKGVNVRGEVEIEPIESPVRNVIGMIPGKGPQADEIIVLGAHYDHLGIRNKGEPGFDPTKDISNGADDNASGTSLVMMMARVYTQGEAPNRSILLMLYTGEELGLLGSAHFAKNPTVDLKKCVAMFNFDMVGRLKDDRLEVGGMRTGSGFEDTVKKHAGNYELNIRDGGGGRGPSDHTNFYNKKIPVLFFFTGIHRQYHKPDDDTPLINFDGAIRIARFAADVIDDIDARSDRPAFEDDTRRATILRQGEDDDAPRREGRGPRAPRDPQARTDGESPERPGGRGGVRLGIVPEEDGEGDGILIAEVSDDSAAEKAGVKSGDRLVRIGKIDIEGIDDAIEAVSKLQMGDDTTLGVVRDGKKLDLKVSFAARGAPRSEARNADPIAAGVEMAIKRLKDEKKVLSSKVTSRAGALSVEVETSDFASTLKISEAIISASTDILQSKAAGEDGFMLEIKLKWPNGSFDTSLKITSKDKKKAAGGSDGHGHGEQAASDDARESMPAVRLGIMPTYGESEGEGYEIDGVIEGGPAATAGMKDKDRIYKIGDKKITSVYEYMDALRAYKPGDEVPVTVIRDGKKIELKVKASGGKSEAK